MGYAMMAKVHIRICTNQAERAPTAKPCLEHTAWGMISPANKQRHASDLTYARHASHSHKTIGSSAEGYVSSAAGPKKLPPPKQGLLCACLLLQMQYGPDKNARIHKA